MPVAGQLTVPARSGPIAAGNRGRPGARRTHPGAAPGRQHGSRNPVRWPWPAEPTRAPSASWPPPAARRETEGRDPHQPRPRTAVRSATHGVPTCSPWPRLWLRPERLWACISLTSRWPAHRPRAGRVIPLRPGPFTVGRTGQPRSEYSACDRRPRHRPPAHAHHEGLTAAGFRSSCDRAGRLSHLP